MITGYAATKLINARLVAVGIKEIPPQMVYNYTSARINKGLDPLIPGTTVDEGGKVKLSEEGVNEWTEKYISKKLNKTTNESTEVEGQLEFEEV